MRNGYVDGWINLADNAGKNARELLELRERVARLDAELDKVVALVHDRAPELVPALMEVVA